ncbi:MAG: class III poly(R)-hydroxyalkanoic acid synthase subunit PhaC [Pontibacterium sp.]
MTGINLTPDNVIQELQDFNSQLIKSYKTLQHLQDVDVGQTAKEEVYREDKLRLYHYTPDGKRSCSTPILITYALVNRPYMIDLEPERSLLRRLLEQGLDVYLVDWGYPDEADRFLDLDDYINHYLNNCVDKVRTLSGQDKINLLGICQGGTFSLCYTALNPEKIKNLITMVTPVDFKTDDNLLSHLVQGIDIDLAVDTYGNIPGRMLNDTFNSLMPMRLGLQKNLSMPTQLKDEETALSFLRMEKWIYDSPDQAGAAFQQFIKQFFQQNKLIKAEAEIGDKRVDLKAIKQPILNIFGAFDHMVPPSASRALAQHTESGDYSEIEIEGGHIGVFVSGKSQKTVAPCISDWLIQRDK